MPLPPDPEERYAAIVAALRDAPDVTHSPDQAGSSKRFGSAGELKVGGKIFAMLSSSSRLVVKLPRQRVDQLVAAGQGERFDPGHGRVMREWLSLDPALDDDWLTLAREALEFVGSKR